MVQKLNKKNRPPSLGGDNVLGSEARRMVDVLEDRYGPEEKRRWVMIPIGKIINWIKRLLK